MKHTKGPWQVGNLVENDYEPRFVEVLGNDGIKLIAKADYSETDEEAATNAHLMAAAPELLESLKMAHLELSSLYREIDGEERKRDSLHINGIPLVEIIDNIINKVEGR